MTAMQNLTRKMESYLLSLQYASPEARWAWREKIDLVRQQMREQEARDEANRLEAAREELNRRESTRQTQGA